MLFGRNRRVGRVVVRSVELVETACLGEVACVVLLGLRVIVKCHHVLEVVAPACKLGSLSHASVVDLFVNLLVLGDETFLWLVVKTPQDFALKALGSVVGVALAVEVFRVDA